MPAKQTRAEGIEEIPEINQAKPDAETGDKPELAERLRAMAAQFGEEAEEEKYTRGHRAAEQLGKMGESARMAAKAGEIQGLPGQTWDQFDALIKGRGLKM